MRLNKITIICIVLCSCANTNNKNSSNITPDSIEVVTATDNTITTIDTTSFDYDSYFKLDSYLAKNPISNEGFETVDFDCAILIYPADYQIDEMIKTEGEEDFYIIADDNNWYQAQATSIIDSLGIKKITAKGQFLRFEGIEKTWDLDIRKKNLPAWNLMFFNRNKEPQIISTVDLTVEQAKDYFDIRE